MSRVIKSGHLKIADPRLIDFISFESEVAATCEEAFEDIEVEDGTNIASQAAKQAEEILKETEDMVKELLATARQEAEKIIKKAREEADGLIQEGKENLQEIKDKAYDEGWQAGYVQGKVKAEEETRNRLLVAQETVNNAKEERRKILNEAEDEIIQLAVLIAQKIILQEISINSEVVVNMVKKSLEKVHERDEISIRVNPEDLESVLKARDEIISAAKGIRKIKEVADPSITPGGCVIDTANGSVDARVEGQLEEIEQSLLEVNPND